MRSTDRDLVRTLPVFSELDAEHLEQMTSGALLQRFPKETRLFDQGEQPDFLHLLLEGQVELSASSADGRETVIEILTPIDYFILAAVLTDTPYLMSARVLEPAKILLLPARKLREQMIQHPRLALAITASLAGHFRRMVRQIKDLKLRTSSQRVGAYLLRQSLEETARTRPDHTGDNSVRFDLPVSKQVLAARLGMTPENLSRAFAVLVEHGIQIKGRLVEIEDRGKLADFCHPDTLIDSVERDLKISAE